MVVNLCNLRCDWGRSGAQESNDNTYTVQRHDQQQNYDKTHKEFICWLEKYQTNQTK